MRPGVEREPWGRLPDGEEVERFTLRNRNGVTASVSAFGASLVSLRVPDRDGALGEILLGLDTPAAYQSDRHYFGSTVGRFAGRIFRGRFALDGVLHQLPMNHGDHHLHGGDQGFSHRLWSAEERITYLEVGVIFRRRSPDGEEGYPGNLDVEAAYWLDDRDRVRIEYRARTDAPTHVNLTNHAYFNLAGRGSVADHRLQLRARTWIPTDAEGIPMGGVSPVAGTDLDFTEPAPMGARSVGMAYDHSLLIQGWDGTLRECARVQDPRSGRTLMVHTTAPVVQFYVPDFPPGTPGRDGGEYRGRAGFCLETQYPPDAPNRPQFPSTRLDPGEEWSSTTILEFGTT
ncbi:MAG: galactose mutarotase [Gemmatimonadota bacterium]